MGSGVRSGEWCVTKSLGRSGNPMGSYDLGNQVTWRAVQRKPTLSRVVSPHHGEDGVSIVASGIGS